MKKLLVALLLICAAVPARAGIYYDLQQSASSATMRMVGAIKMYATSMLNTPTITLDSVAGGISTTGTSTFTATGAGTFSVQTSSGINAAAGTVKAPSFVGAFSGDGSNLTGVGTAALAANSVDTTKLANAAVTNIKLAANAVDTSKLVASGVAAGTYGSSGLIPVFTVTTDGRITGGSSVAPVITNAMIAANAVDTGKLAVTGVGAGTYGSGSQTPVLTVTADGRLTSVTLTATTPGSVNASTFTINAIPPATIGATVWTIVPGSTLTYSTNGTSPIKITVSGSLAQSSGNGCFGAVFMDGAYLPGESATVGYGPEFNGSAQQLPWGFTHVVVAQSAGSHVWTFGLKSSGAGNCVFSTTAQVSQFIVEDK